MRPAWKKQFQILIPCLNASRLTAPDRSRSTGLVTLGLGLLNLRRLATEPTLFTLDPCRYCSAQVSEFGSRLNHSNRQPYEVALTSQEREYIRNSIQRYENLDTFLLGAGFRGGRSSKPAGD